MTTRPIDLEPCPFCDAPAHLEEDVPPRAGFKIHAACGPDCKVQPSVWAEYADEARDAWNTRTRSVEPPKSTEFDPNGYADMLHALRHANDGWALTIWNAADGDEAGWKLWRTLDAKYSEKDPGWVMTIPVHHICDELEKEKP